MRAGPAPRRLNAGPLSLQFLQALRPGSGEGAARSRRVHP